MANGKERVDPHRKVTSIVTVFAERRMDTFIALLMKRIRNKQTHLNSKGKFGLIRAKAIDIGCTPEHTKGNLRSEVSSGIRLLETI